MAEYEHGSMDISEQERTFSGYMRWMVRTVILIALVLIYLAMTQT